MASPRASRRGSGRSAASSAATGGSCERRLLLIDQRQAAGAGEHAMSSTGVAAKMALKSRTAVSAGDLNIGPPRLG